MPSICLWCLLLLLIDAYRGSENFSLLSRAAKPSKHILSSYLQRDPVSISLLIYSTSTFNGWLPTETPNLAPTFCCSSKNSQFRLAGTSSSVYYVHPTNKVTTEIKLRGEKMLTGGSWPITVKSCRVARWKEHLIPVMRYGRRDSVGWRGGLRSVVIDGNENE